MTTKNEYLARIVDNIYEFDEYHGFCGHDVPREAMERIVKTVLRFEMMRLQRLADEETL